MTGRIVAWLIDCGLRVVCVTVILADRLWQRVTR
jgi:hypothetical protein